MQRARRGGWGELEDQDSLIKAKGEEEKYYYFMIDDHIGLAGVLNSLNSLVSVTVPWGGIRIAESRLVSIRRAAMFS